MTLYTLPADTAILLRADGTDFHSNAVIKNYTPVYARSFPQIVTFANNIRGFTEFGDEQDYIDHFTLEAWSDQTAAQIKNNIAREATHGLFTLKVPDITNPNSTAIDWYLIRFFECDFTPLDTTPRRRGVPHIHVAEVSDIEVLEHETT